MYFFSKAAYKARGNGLTARPQDTKKSFWCALVLFALNNKPVLQIISLVHFDGKKLSSVYCGRERETQWRPTLWQQTFQQGGRGFFGWALPEHTDINCHASQTVLRKENVTEPRTQAISRTI